MIAFGKISPGRIGFFQGGSGTFQCTTRASLAIRWVINGTAIVFGGPNPIGSATNSIATAHLVDVSVDESFVGIRVSVLISLVYTRVLTRVQLTSGREPSSNPPMDVG